MFYSKSIIFNKFRNWNIGRFIKSLRNYLNVTTLKQDNLLKKINYVNNATI